jgi:hypothetical protein
MRSESNAAAALRTLSEKMDAWRAELRAATNVVVSLEQSGVTAVTPSDAAYDVDEAAHARVNGASYPAAPTGIKPGVELFLKRREVDELKRTINLAAEQTATAQIDRGRELLAEHDGEIRSLHRKRALILLNLFAVNAEVETMRLKLIRAGSSVPHSLDGWTQRFFGLSSPPTPTNDWPMKYLAQCIAAKIITEKDLNQ